MVSPVTTTANVSVEYQLPRGFSVTCGYMFEEYEVEDWMQEPSGGWVDAVSDYFVRDSTLDNRWGNRLVRLGGCLAPSYTANVAVVNVGYNW